jgi:hypothetical protein
MTQPAKSQEPSMEEILASIRRIIADDDASKAAPKPAEAPKPVGRPVPPPRSSPPPSAAPPVMAQANPNAGDIESQIESEIETEGSDDLAAMSGAGLADPDILDLTESMATPSLPQPAPMPNPPPQFQGIEPLADINFDEAEPIPPAQEKIEEPQPQVPRDGLGGDRPSELHQAQEVHKAGGASEVHEARAAEAHEVRAVHEARDAGTGRDDERGQLLSKATTAAVDSAFNALAHTVLVQNARTLDDLVREMLRPMLKTWLDDNLPRMVERLVRAEIERVARGR